MAETATIARPYAEAVFGLADKTGSTGNWLGILAALAHVAGNAEMQACISDPNVGENALYDLVIALSKGKEDFPAEARNFVRVLIANGRLALLPEIHAQFADLKNESEGVLEAEIRSAYPLDNAQINGLVAEVSRRFKRRVQPRVTLDKDLIGGVHVTVGDEVIDGSVRGKLADMATALKG
jgi:F-type H+-transporting ATPase subunit delta